jgi:F420-dependent methylenetetrahydromethanopterin dehydrogenase
LAVVRQQRSKSGVVEGGIEQMSVKVEVELPENLRSKLPDSDMQGAPYALLRAAKRAREIARRTNTPLVIIRDGKLVEEWVTDDDDV